MSRPLRLIPVIDLWQGVVVRGVAGNRDEYRPVESRIVPTPAPLDVARAFRRYFGFTELYVADLDAIRSGRPNWNVYKRLIEDGFRLLVDAGLSDPETADRVLATGAGAIVGLESCPGPELLRTLIARHSGANLVFSLDLKAGVPLVSADAWGTNDPFAIALAALEAGVRRMIVLDLAQVGIGAGISTLPLCQRLRAQCPEVEIITGGGVRNIEDVFQLAVTEVIDGVLVASALHDGRLLPDEVQRFVR